VTKKAHKKRAIGGLKLQFMRCSVAGVAKNGQKKDDAPVPYIVKEGKRR